MHIIYPWAIGLSGTAKETGTTACRNHDCTILLSILCTICIHTYGLPEV